VKIVVPTMDTCDYTLEVEVKKLTNLSVLARPS